MAGSCSESGLDGGVEYGDGVEKTDDPSLGIGLSGAALLVAASSSSEAYS